MTAFSRSDIPQTRRWVIKIGSALLTNNGQGLDHDAIKGWVDQIIQLRKTGYRIIIVSSGSVAEGMSRLGWTKRPHAIHQLQAAAATGQMGLIQAYESCFQCYGIHTAQVLLTHDDFTNRQRYLNARSTIQTLTDLGIIPVINENDTVSNDEIKLGDNDTLAGMVTAMSGSELQVILTDQAGFYEKDPNLDPDSKLVESAPANLPELEAMAASGGVGKTGRGGMLTKVRSARIASRAGVATLIANGREASILLRIASGEHLGTLFYPDQDRLLSRKQWIASIKIKGELMLDDGAVNVLRTSGKSLLPVGVTSASGSFRRGELVSCIDRSRNEVARGLINYNCDETRRIMGLSSNLIESTLGYVDEPELIHRDNLVLIA